MPIVAASFCPQPPLLIPAVAAGAAPELDDLRAACLASVRAATDGCNEVVVLGRGPESRMFDETAYGDLRPYGVDYVDRAHGNASDTADPSGEQLPLSLTIGRWLLREAGWSGTTRLVSVTPGDGLFWGSDDPQRALLVLGDGAPSRSLQAPGYLDDRAEPYDATIAAALASGDPARLAGLDERVAESLGVAGWPAWRSAAGMLADRRWEATLRYDAAPYGVGYFVADWRLAP